MTGATRRLLAGLPLAVFASCIASAPDGAGGSVLSAADTYPTNFDYLVLASIADSQQPFTMAGFRSSAREPVAK
jgi:hypothetical protein